MTSPSDEPAVVRQLLVAYRRDRDAGVPIDADRYRAMFPGHEDLVTRELAALTAGERTVAGEPIRARTPGPLRRLVPWCRRHPALAAAGAIALLAAAALVVLQQRALQQTRAARDEAMAVNDFLVERVLLAATPAEARGEELTAEEVLEAATRSVEERLPGDTAVGAAVREVLGRAWRRLGDVAESREAFARSAEIRARLLGPDAEPTLRSRLGEVRAMIDLDEPVEARRQLDRIARRARDALGRDHPLTLAVRHVEGELFIAEGSVTWAADAFRDLAEDRARVLGADHDDTLEARQALGRCLHMIGRLDAAESVMRDVLARREATLPADSPTLQRTRGDLASLLQDAGDWDEAGELYEVGVEYAARVYGKDHAQYAVALNDHASFLERRALDEDDQAGLERAEAMYRESLAVRREAYGPEHAAVARAWNDLGVCLRHQGEFAAAADAIGRALAIQREQLGPDHRGTIRTAYSAGATRMMAGDADGALPLLEYAVQRASRERDFDAADLIRMRLAWATCLHRLGRQGDAILQLERCRREAESLPTSEAALQEAIEERLAEVQAG